LGVASGGSVREHCADARLLKPDPAISSTRCAVNRVPLDDDVFDMTVNQVARYPDIRAHNAWS
jgi:hypothetical protein